MSTSALTRERRAMPDRTGSLITVDAALIVGLGFLASWPLADAYGGQRWAIAVVGGLACGVGLAWVAQRFTWGIAATASALPFVYLLAGPAFAVPSYATAGVLPNWATLQVLLTGAVESWHQSIQQVAPLGSGGTLLIVPWVLGLVSGVLAGYLMWRTRFGSAAPIVVAGLFVAACAFGDPDSRFILTRGLLLTVCLVVWSRWRSQRYVQDRWIRRIAWTSGVVLIAGSAAIAVVSLIDTPDRSVLRNLAVPHFDPRDHPSPLSRYRLLASGENDEILFNTFGTDEGERLRLASMMYYDGNSWHVSGGEIESPFLRLPSLERAGYGGGVIVSVDAYRGVWVPGLGEPTGLEVVNELGSVDHQAAAHTVADQNSGTVAQVDGVHWGESYHFRFRPSERPTPEEISAASAGDVWFSAPAEAPEALMARTDEWVAEAGDPSGGALAQTLADGFHQQGFYSDGGFGETPSEPGHGDGRLTDFAEELFMVGNAEQYAAAMALAAQEYGLPARAVIGFEVPEADGTIRARDTRAWTEVNLQGYGWVAFDPTPPEYQRLEPGVIAPSPPSSPNEPDDPDTQPEQDEADQEDSTEDAEATGWFRWWWLVLVAAIGVALTALPVLKWWRRRRRRRTGSAAARIASGWTEVVDRARDLGVVIAASDTRGEASAAIAGRYPDADVRRLAAVADDHQYGAGESDDDDATAYWVEVKAVLASLRRGTPRLRRPRIWLSPASIRWGRRRHEMA